MKQKIRIQFVLSEQDRGLQDFFVFYKTLNLNVRSTILNLLLKRGLGIISPDEDQKLKEILQEARQEVRKKIETLSTLEIPLVKGAIPSKIELFPPNKTENGVTIETPYTEDLEFGEDLADMENMENLEENLEDLENLEEMEAIFGASAEEILETPEEDQAKGQAKENEDEDLSKLDKLVH